MEKIKMKKFFAHKIFKILKWVFLIIVGLYLILVIVRVFHFINLDKTNAQVQKIHSTKITMGDVMGVNLPPDPGALADETVEGIDVNANGIRDDVELAIFEKYPDSAKTRAGLLQYALAQQMQVIQPFVNTVIATEVIREHSRARSCLSGTLVPRKTRESFRSNLEMEKIDEYISFMEDIQLNTNERKEKRSLFFENLRSYSDLEGDKCDFDYSGLDN